jgi:hypothetical protein
LLLLQQQSQGSGDFEAVNDALVILETLRNLEFCYKEFNKNVQTIQQTIPNPKYLKPKIYLKLYQDVIVFYTYILFIVICGTTSTYYYPFKRILSKRIPINFIPKIINIWPHGLSLGEVFLLFSILALYSYWFWFWSVGFGYTANNTKTGPHLIVLQRYARVMGEMGVLTAAFVCFPITRNSLWESVFGVPFDRFFVLKNKNIGIIIIFLCL